MMNGSPHEQNALAQLIQMVGHTLPPPPTSSTAYQSHQSNTNKRSTLQHQQNGMSAARPPTSQQQSAVGFKAPKPLERRTAAAMKPPTNINGQTIVPQPVMPFAANAQQHFDPRLLFPAAFVPSMPTGGASSVSQPKMPAFAHQPLGMNHPFLAPTAAAAQFPLSGPFAFTPEMLNTAMGSTTMPTWPMDTSSLLQQPAMLNKLYADYLAVIQQQQQQYLQSFMLQSANAQTCIKLNESKTTPPAPPQSAPANLDPLASLQSMVHSQTPPEQKRPVIRSSMDATPPSSIQPKMEEKHDLKEENEEVEEEIIVDVEENDQEQKTQARSPMSAPPKFMSNASSSSSSSFSIADILHSSSTPGPSHNFQQQQLEMSRTTLTPIDPSNLLATETQQQNSDLANRLSPASSTSKKPLDPVNAKHKKAKREKHIEFHRRLKTLTTRCKFAQCQKCGDVVANNNSELTSHVYNHSSVCLFGCWRCERSFRQRADLFKHCSDAHPNEVFSEEKVLDLRDMGKLCDLLEKCFPRNSKLVIDTLLTKILNCCKGSKSLQCRLCEKDVPPNVTSLKNHLAQHPRYRCKLCHFTNDDEIAQMKHGQEQHDSESAQYNVTSASVVLSSILTSCFGDYMQSDQLVFAEEIAALNENSTPQGSPNSPSALQQSSNGKPA